MDGPHVQPVVGLHQSFSGMRPLLRGNLGKAHGLRCLGRPCSAAAPRRNQPLRWDQDAAQSGQRARVFCASMADVFEWNRALDNLRERLWTLIESTPNLDWLLLTKRPHLARRLAPWASAWPTHVWLGTTVENQLFADRRIRFLLDVPCRYRFLSCEPLLGPVDLSAYIGGLHWIIAGGESGGRARPTHPDWIRLLRDQCVNAGVAFHFKQWPRRSKRWSPTKGYSRRSVRPAPCSTPSHADTSRLDGVRYMNAGWTKVDALMTAGWLFRSTTGASARQWARSRAAGLRQRPRLPGRRGSRGAPSSQRSSGLALCATSASP